MNFSGKVYAQRTVLCFIVEINGETQANNELYIWAGIIAIIVASQNRSVVALVRHR